MTFTLEQIDELKRRANVSYAEAKEALEKSNGDLLGALVYLEQQNKIRPNPEQTCETECNLLGKVKKLIKKGNNTRFIIEKRERKVVDLSVTVSAIATACASYVVIPGLLLALGTGHKIRFEGKGGEGSKINNALNKISNAVDTAKKKFAEDDESTVTQ